jgi:hypothetical protein
MYGSLHRRCRVWRSQHTLASNLINRSFRFLSNPPLLTRRNGVVLAFCCPAAAPAPDPLASGPTRPIPGAPKILGSRKDAELLEVGIGDRAEEGDDGGSARLGVSGELDHRGFMLDGARGSMVTMRSSDEAAVYVSAEEDEMMLW